MADYTPSDPRDAFIRGMVLRGWTPAEAAGAAGNVQVESGYSPSVKSSVPSEQSYGLLQWNHERLQGLKNYADTIGRDWRDPEVQMDWIDMERRGRSVAYGGSDERTAYRNALSGGGTPAQIAARFGKYVERPQDLSKSVGARESAAGGLVSNIALRTGEPRPAIPRPEETPYQRLIDKYGGRDNIPPGDYNLDQDINPNPEPGLAPKQNAKVQKASAEEDQRDIIWQKIDPKTYYLYNKFVKGPQEEGGTNFAGMEDRLARDKQLAVDQQIFRHDMLTYGRDAAVQRADHYNRIRALTEFDHDMQNDPKFDLHSRMGDLFDRGILRMDERGDIYHDGIELPPEMDRRIEHAAQLWDPQEEPDITTPEIGGGIESEIDRAKQMTPTTLDPNAQQGEE